MEEGVLDVTLYIQNLKLLIRSVSNTFYITTKLSELCKTKYIHSIDLKFHKYEGKHTLQNKIMYLIHNEYSRYLKNDKFSKTTK